MWKKKLYDEGPKKGLGLGLFISLVQVAVSGHSNKILEETAEKDKTHTAISYIYIGFAQQFSLR